MKNVLVMVRSKPHTTMNYYEALRVAAGLWEHKVRVLWMSEGVLVALNTADRFLIKQFLEAFPDLNIETYVEEEALIRYGFSEKDILPSARVATPKEIADMIEEAEVSIVF